jgi:hypothetical protein
MSDKLSGIKFPNFGKRVFTEDWNYEQESKSEEIITRDKDLLGTGIQDGGSIAVGSSPAMVDLLEATTIYDSEGRRFEIPPTANIPVPFEATCKIVVRHKFDEEEFTSPSNMPSDGPIIHRSNGYEIIARQGSLADGDVPLREITTDDEGLVTLGDDLRVFKGLLGKNVKNDQIQDKHLHPDIKTGNLSELDSALIAEINPDESNPLKWVKAINKVFQLKQALEQRVVSLEATQVPLGGYTPDDLDFLPTDRFKPTNGNAIDRSLLAPELLSKLIRNVVSIDTSGNRVNLPSHGKSEGDLVKFAFSGGGITALAEYYVRNKTDNDFQISTGPATAIIDLTSDQTGEMLTHVRWGFGNGSTTINVPDRRGIYKRNAGVHGSRAKAAGGNYDGGPIGFEGQDMSHNHIHQSMGRAISVGIGAGTSIILDTVSQNSTSPVSNGNGTPRMGNETTPAWVSENEKVRIK